MPQHVVVLVNGAEGSAAGVRARGLFEPLRGDLRIDYLYRDADKIGSLKRFLRALLARRPDLVYVVDTAVSGAGAAIFARLLRGIPFVVDTGDLGYELAELMAKPNWAGRKVIGIVEATALRLARAVVVRGTFHKQILDEAGRRRVSVIRDGVHTEESRPLDVSDLRRELGLADCLCVGMMGSIVWNEPYQICYGWDLIEAMGLLPPSLPVRALIVGDGDGLPRLQARAEELGLGDRVRFVGRIPYEDVTRYTNVMDAALSTQTNNRVGSVRTTGKLAHYMACGCYVLATDVGEARLLLPPEMRLPYDGIKDMAYPARLAQKVTELAGWSPGQRDEATAGTVARAQAEMDYNYLSSLLREALDPLLNRRPPGIPVNAAETESVV